MHSKFTFPLPAGLACLAGLGLMTLISDLGRPCLLTLSKAAPEVGLVASTTDDRGSGRLAKLPTESQWLSFRGSGRIGTDSDVLAFRGSGRI
ncbi:MAG TPA: hypothetical protein IGR64_00845, partial [Leptolyngbyaceae cyanobacterium M65_K2018_010]|nr:hypothetical protein [Leptolyngbyaceae cyanobacterium M65_K2018_010]